MSKFKMPVALSAGMLLQACQAFQGIPVVLKPSGVVTMLENKEPVRASPNFSAGVPGLFERSYNTAELEQREISAGRVLKPTSAADAPSVHARQMAEDGVNLVGVYCNDFFRTRGDSQTVLNVARDATAASGSLASSVLAFASPANAVASGIISLVTATASNGLDVYTKNFLFGSDNIETVRTMTLAALAAHKSAALPANDTSIWDFGGAFTTIMDHQDMCTPASIRSLVLSSIAKSKFTPASPVPAAPAAENVQGTVKDRHIQIQVVN